MGYRDQTPLTTPERVRSEAQQTERDQRVLESPERHRTPHHIRIARSSVSVPPIPPPVFMPLSIVPPPAPIYNNLPAHLAQQYAALPDLYLGRQASVPPPQLAPAFVHVPAPEAPAPAPAPAQYPNLPADLAQQLAALPPLIEHGRGRGRGRGRVRVRDRGRGRGRGNITTAPAPLPYAEVAAQYAALPAVCFILFINLILS